MNYKVTYNGETVAQGLSAGELNQLLIDYDKQIKEKHHKEVFRYDLGLIDKNEDFEEFLYSNKFEMDVYINHNGGHIMSIEIEE